MKRTVLLHLLQKFDDDFTTGPDQDLSTTTLFGIGYCLETISENRHANHLWWLLLLLVGGGGDGWWRWWIVCVLCGGKKWMGETRQAGMAVVRYELYSWIARSCWQLLLLLLLHSYLESIVVALLRARRRYDGECVWRWNSAGNQPTPNRVSQKGGNWVMWGGATAWLTALLGDL
jgi:hypothetical protein